jgi:hypothetical protein
MVTSLPSVDKRLWRRFVKAGGRMIALSWADRDEVYRFMRWHNTEALSEDALTAYTLWEGLLLECNPTVCGEPQSDCSIFL